MTVGGLSGLAASLTDRVAIGIMAGLVARQGRRDHAGHLAGRPVHPGRLDEGLAWIDVIGLAVLGGIGFTVSLLIGELAFGIGTERDDHVKVAVLAGSLLAALLAAVVLRLRNRVYRRIHEAESADTDHDGIPDVYQD